MRVDPPGSVFQTGLPLWASNRESKDPRLLRDRPTDGLQGYAILCGLCAPTEGGYGGDVDGFAAMALQGERLQCMRGVRMSAAYRIAAPFAPPPVKILFCTFTLQKARGGQWHGPDDNVPDWGGKL